MKGKGYQLQEPLILLNEKHIKQRTHTHPLWIEVFEQLRSTNDYLKTLCNSPTIKVCLAETQTHGRGRFQRIWQSPFGQNIYFSMLYPFQKDISALAGLNLVTGLAICKVLESALQRTDISIKWPNDIVIDHKKIAGSIIDIQAETYGICYAIIGIGINVNMQYDLTRSIRKPWTSMRKLSNTYYDRNILCGTLIDTLLDYLQRFDQEGFDAFLKEWKQKDALRNQKIRLKYGNNTFEGTALGITPQGNLQLQLKNKQMHSFSAGETTITP